MPLLTRLERGWTYDELVEFTESEAASLAGVDPRRYEIVDGALLVNPSASMRHQFLSAKLQSLLLGQAPDGYFVCGPIDVNLHPSYRAPDLVAVTIDSARHTRRPLPAAEVLLALEIVSPSSVTDDRITKPAQYAAHGIATYVRVETEPVVTVTVYELTDGAYAEVGSWGPGETARLTHPFGADIPVDAITP